MNSLIMINICIPKHNYIKYIQIYYVNIITGKVEKYDVQNDQTWLTIQKSSHMNREFYTMWPNV